MIYWLVRQDEELLVVFLIFLLATKGAEISWRGTSLADASFVVNDVVDLAVAGQVDSQRVVEFHAWVFWGLDGTLDIDPVVSEVSIHSYSISFVALNMVTNLVAHKASISIGLINVIGKLRLVEVGPSLFSVPFEQVSKRMLRS